MTDVATKFDLSGEDEYVINRIQDCEPIADHARSLQNAGEFGSSEMRHCASFPVVLVEKYIADQKITWHEFLNNPEHASRMLADPALSAFRIWRGT